MVQWILKYWFPSDNEEEINANNICSPSGKFAKRAKIVPMDPKIIYIKEIIIKTEINTSNAEQTKLPIL